MTVVSTSHPTPRPMQRFTLAAAAAIFVLTLSSCDDDAGQVSASPPPAEITMTDYAYEMPEIVRPGQTLRVRNAGDELHMMLLGRLIGGATLEDVFAAMSSDDDSAVDSLVEQVGAPATFLPPGRAISISTPALVEGEYVSMCFFGTEGDGTPHAFNGMAATFTVGGTPVDPPPADAEFTVTSGEPIEGPTALDSGHHTLGIVAHGDAAELSITIWRVNPGQTLAEVRSHVNELSDADVPAHGTGTDIAEHLVAAVYPPGEAGSVLLGVDLEPGIYILAAVDLDDDSEFDSTTEQILITVG